MTHQVHVEQAAAAAGADGIRSHPAEHPAERDAGLRRVEARLPAKLC